MKHCLGFPNSASASFLHIFLVNLVLKSWCFSLSVLRWAPAAALSRAGRRGGPACHLAASPRHPPHRAAPSQPVNKGAIVSSPSRGFVLEPSVPRAMRRVPAGSAPPAQRHSRLIPLPAAQGSQRIPPRRHRHLQRLRAAPVPVIAPENAILCLWALHVSLSSCSTCTKAGKIQEKQRWQGILLNNGISPFQTLSPLDMSRCEGISFFTKRFLSRLCSWLIKKLQGVCQAEHQCSFSLPFAPQRGYTAVCWSRNIFADELLLLEHFSQGQDLWYKPVYYCGLARTLGLWEQQVILCSLLLVSIDTAQMLSLLDIFS